MIASDSNRRPCASDPRKSTNLNFSFASIPEVDRAVGKLGRAETPLDPAPISMIETVVNYLPEFKSDAQGRVLRFRTGERGNFLYGEDEQLIVFSGIAIMTMLPPAASSAASAASEAWIAHDVHARQRSSRLLS